LRELRIDELGDAQTLAQLIGPPGITPAMFDDKQRGNMLATRTQSTIAQR
jgi:hypothetical protein